MAAILMPLPSRGFDILNARCATRGRRWADGDGPSLGLFASVLKADQNGPKAHDAMFASSEFRSPLRYEAIAGRGCGMFRSRQARWRYLPWGCPIRPLESALRP